MFDIVFISYEEPTAEDNWLQLKARFPQAKRLHGIKGLHYAHITAAHMVDSEMFYCVDADALIDDDFAFDHVVDPTKRDHVHVFRAKNPINDLVYGYGAVKLLPTADVKNLKLKDFKPDMTTSINRKYVVVNKLSNVTGFNTDDYNAWRSGFRECTKLASGVIDGQLNDETQQRLTAWTTLGETRPFGPACIRGARDGMEFGTRNANDVDSLKLINDNEWLRARYLNGSA